MKPSQLDEKTIAKGKVITSTSVNPQASGYPDIAVLRQPSLIAMDMDWQFPAVTERHAFQRVTAAGQAALKGAVYIAYPWATLIDKMQHKASDADLHLDRFEQFCALLPRGVEKVTVCQHIHGRKYIDLFRQAGVTDVFWSHATQDDTAQAASERAADNIDVRFHPFPLYPVQVPEAFPEAGPEADATPRKHLFSFIGARANKYYLAETRNWILDLLKDDPRGLVVGRDSWHYQKVVYDLQIGGQANSAEALALVDASASEQFCDSLLNSTFSLCPAGSGPNSIRLWESLGAGTIPVVLADTWAPPGDRRLWDMAAVFCKETPQEIRALPDRLAAIASEPGRLAQMRHAMRQIWLLYGPQAFVTDVQHFLLSKAGADKHVVGPSKAELPEDQIYSPLTADNSALLLCHCAAELLLDPATMLERIETDPRLAGALEKARTGLPADTAVRRHYEAVIEHAQRKAKPVALARPALHKALPRICLLGRHSNRTPLSYAPIRRLIEARLEIVETPAEADLVVTGFNIDLQENFSFLRQILETKRAPRIAVISEEPLWDITWSGPFTGRDGKKLVNGTEIAYTFLAHETSDIYEFDRVPYFLLTSDTYAVRYTNLMARFDGLSPDLLLERWRAAAVPAAFFAEKRTGEMYSKSFPERDVTALSAYRTEVAERTKGAGVLRAGKGWGHEVRRQDMPDWHLDKLAQLDGRTKMLAAFENVHQRHYITEKIFDAFVVGAVPAYWAGPKHRIFEMVPETAMLNMIGLTPAAAAERIAVFAPDRALAEIWLITCARLARLFGDFQAIAAERQRVADAVMAEILKLTDS